MEMMLRQVLMNNTAATGKRFEGRRQRYLFFYPTYFFTPETLQVLHEVYLQMQRMRFTALRRLLLPENNDAEPRANLDLATFQLLDDLLLDPTLPDRPGEDRLFRMRYMDYFPVRAEFTQDGDQLLMKIENRSAKDLSDCWLLTPGQRYALGDIKRGVSWTRAFSLAPPAPESRRTRRASG